MLLRSNGAAQPEEEAPSTEDPPRTPPKVQPHIRKIEDVSSTHKEVGDDFPYSSGDSRMGSQSICSRTLNTSSTNQDNGSMTICFGNSA